MNMNDEFRFLIYKSETEDVTVNAIIKDESLYVGVRISHPQPMKRAGKSSVYADFRLLIFLMTDLLQGLCKGFSGAFCRQGVVRCVGFI